jgi:predicted nucleotidyltransferase
MTREEAIREVTRRLVEFYDPETVYLFGSAARGDDTPQSDLDFCVVMPDSAPRDLLKPGAIHRRLLDVPECVDVFRIRQSEFDRRRNWLVSIPSTVRREGRILYAREPGKN